MPLSTDVNLPRSHKAKFPDKCVVCGRPSPESTVRLMTGALGWWTWLLWHFGSSFSVRAPACASCGRRLHVHRFAGLLITIGLAMAAVWFVWPLLSDQIPRPVRKWIVMGLAVICMSPQILWRVWSPDPFDITCYSESVDYEFRDEDMAHEFAELNQDAEWVKIS
jgi:hypothetical protein